MCSSDLKYENGKPVELPDSLRATFKTKAGRSVLDGGGIRPDVMVDKASDIGLMKTLQEKYLIFDYVTQFALKNPTIDAPEKFKFDDFEGFVAFLAKRNFQYDSESEKLIKRLRDEAKKEKYATIESELVAIEAKVQSDKKNDLQKHKAEIVHEIENEIISRYYYEKGMIKMNLRNDAEIETAIKLLNDPAKYKALLTKK